MIEFIGTICLIAIVGIAIQFIFIAFHGGID